MLQADMLAKVGSLKNLEQSVNHMEAFETAMQNQNKISCILGIAELWMPISCLQKWAKNTEQTMNNNDSCPITTQCVQRLW